MLTNTKTARIAGETPMAYYRRMLWEISAIKAIASARVNAIHSDRTVMTVDGY